MEPDLWGGPPYPRDPVRARPPVYPLGGLENSRGVLWVYDPDDQGAGSDAYFGYSSADTVDLPHE